MRAQVFLLQSLNRTDSSNLGLEHAVHSVWLGRRCVMVGILGWILFGLVVGAIAKLVMPGRDPGASS
jgi:hypothetical protein